MVTILLMVPLGTDVNEVKSLQFVIEEISGPSPSAAGHLTLANFRQIGKGSIKKCALRSRISVLQLPVLELWESHLIFPTLTFLIYKVNILGPTLFSVDCPGD